MKHTNGNSHDILHMVIVAVANSERKTVGLMKNSLQKVVTGQLAMRISACAAMAVLAVFLVLISGVKKPSW